MPFISRSFISTLLITLLMTPLTQMNARAEEQPQKGAPVSIHVSPAGDNNNAGTEDRPLADLSGVLERLARLHKSGTKTNIEVILHEGVYRLEQPLQIGPEHLPAGDASLTFTGAKGTRPTISGGRLITGWKKNDNGTFSARIEEVARGEWNFRELFVNGLRRPRARHPNEGYLRIDKSVEDKRTGFTFHPGDVPDKVRPGTELVFLHDWSITRVPVRSVDPKKRLLMVDHNIGCAAPHYAIDHFETHPRYYLENDPALLDQPGEWYLDSKSGVITYHPFPDETIARIEAVAPLSPGLLKVQGTETTPVRNVHFRGLSFEHAAWKLPPGGYASGQASVHEWRDSSPRHSARKMMESALVFERASHCSIVDCRVRHLGLSGVLFGSDTHHCRLEGSLLEDISGNSVNVGEDTSRRVKGRAWWQSAPEQTASHHVIANNLIQNGGRQFFGCVAVWVGIAKNCHIHHNEIRNHPYTGISLGWMWNPTPTTAQGHVVEHNHIHHVMQTLSDGGGIYTLGRQPETILRANHIHHVPLNAGRAESNGMFLDQGSDAIRIAGNVIHTLDRSPLRFHQAKSIVVEKNILVVPNEKTPAYRYNNTNPETIEKKENTVIESDEFQLKMAESIIKSAGLQAAYRKGLGLE